MRSKTSAAKFAIVLCRFKNPFAQFVVALSQLKNLIAQFAVALSNFKFLVSKFVILLFYIKRSLAEFTLCLVNCLLSVQLCALGTSTVPCQSHYALTLRTLTWARVSFIHLPERIILRGSLIPSGKYILKNLTCVVCSHSSVCVTTLVKSFTWPR